MPGGEQAGNQSVEPEPEPTTGLSDADMPPIESLDENADYSPFLSPRVSSDLRRLALRKLFHSPKFNLRDGLNDYDEDYTCFAGLGDTVAAELRQAVASAVKPGAESAPSLADDPAVTTEGENVREAAADTGHGDVNSAPGEAG